MICKEFNEVPKGFKRLEGTTTAPRDKVWVSGLVSRKKWNAYKETTIASDINNVRKRRG